jgi:type IV pilus assembly protein PilV
MKRHRNVQLGSQHQRGFTLLEVLIALVVLSIGLLGIAALQGVGLRSSQGAYLTSQASLLAYDIADRIRANPQPVDNYDFNTTTIDCSQPLPTTPLLTADLAEWACSLERLLPNGSATIVDSRDPATGIFNYVIDIQWEDLQAEEDGGEPVPWSYQLVIEL